MQRRAITSSSSGWFEAPSGAGANEDSAPHLLAVITHQTHETLIEVPIATKPNEISVAQALLGWVPLHQRVATADALHCQRATAQAILNAGGDYLLSLKGNWPAQYAAIVTYFTDPDAKTTDARTIDRQKGRREDRPLRVTTELSDYLTGFPQLTQVGEITRIVEDKRGTHQEVDYFVTSARADATTLLTLIWGHWSIEMA